MTSDAKIGLLLGLVFIFVIAFIINGLPNFGSRAQTAEAAPPMNFQSDDLGVAGNAQEAQERLDWEQLLAQESETLADFEPTAVAADVEDPDPAGTAQTEEPRSVYTLDALMGGVSRTIEDVVRGFGEASRSVTLQAQSSEPAPAIEALTSSREAPEAAEPANVTRGTDRSTRPETARRTARKIYVVQAGDVLATVAKKAYGPEEGNKLANVKRIFEANRNALMSPDEIFVGQKLLIPPLPQTKGTVKAEAALSEALFEKVQDIGKRNLADMKVKKPKGRYYVVQDGDSLWRIAVSQLSSGTRSEEIAKLNTDILKSKDATLAIGMRLRLPAK